MALGAEHEGAAAGAAGAPVSTGPLAPSARRGWEAELNLRYAFQQGRTVLAERSHHGPLYVQRPFYPEGPARCHSYLLHPPGGVVSGPNGGDRLGIGVTVDPQAHALITTPAAGKFYRSGGGRALLQQTLRVRDLGVLEWLPQETICFAGCNAVSHTRVELAPSARFVGWEVLCLGRPASGEDFSSGQVLQRLELWRGGLPLLLERTQLQGGDDLLQAAWGLQGRTVLGTLVALHPAKALAAELHALLQAPGLEAPDSAESKGLAAAGDDLVSITTVNGVLVARCLSRHAEHARSWLEGVWRLLRPLVAGVPAVAPRIWST